jgi:hypothetical protein
VRQDEREEAIEHMKATGYAPVNGLEMYYEIHGEVTLSSCCTVHS